MDDKIQKIAFIVERNHKEENENLKNLAKMLLVISNTLGINYKFLHEFQKLNTQLGYYLFMVQLH